MEGLVGVEEGGQCNIHIFLSYSFKQWEAFISAVYWGHTLGAADDPDAGNVPSSLRVQMVTIVMNSVNSSHFLPTNRQNIRH